jgi:vacuolar-type H+-ATPase subunit H
MNIYAVLESLQREVTESKPLPWPLQEKSVVDRERLLKILDKTRDSLPEEVKQARWISRETERIAAESSNKADRVVREAQSKGREILRAAEDEMERLVSKEEVYVRAREEAQKLIEEARQEARRTREDADRYGRETRQDAERYAMKVLNGMEGELNRILAIIKKGQDSLGVDRD